MENFIGLMDLRKFAQTVDNHGTLMENVIGLMDLL
jgi:hypothetical protein